MFYYSNAINYFVELGCKDFIVFSDDIEWCKSQFTRKQFPNVDSFVFSENQSPFDDMLLQANCANNIVARSTFSFFSAWLNRNDDKIVVCDDNPHLFKTCNIDMVPSYFHRINGDAIVKPKLKLDTVTLFAVATTNVESTVEALKYSMREIKYAACKLISHYKPANLPDDIQYEYCPKFERMEDWCRFIFYDVHKHIDTEHGFLCHNDGYVVFPESFDPEFLKYDYIGSLWPIMPNGLHVNPTTGKQERMGNSVGLRSRRLMELPSKLNIPWEKFENNYHEDTQISVFRRSIFEEHGMKYAPIEVAARFARESVVEENKHIEKPFMFHRYHNESHPNWNFPKF